MVVKSRYVGIFNFRDLDYKANTHIQKVLLSEIQVREAFCLFTLKKQTMFAFLIIK